MPAHVQQAGAGPLGTPRLRAAPSFGLPPLHTQLVCSELLQTAFPVSFPFSQPPSLPPGSSVSDTTQFLPAPSFSLSLSLTSCYFCFLCQSRTRLWFCPSGCPGLAEDTGGGLGQGGRRLQEAPWGPLGTALPSEPRPPAVGGVGGAGPRDLSSSSTPACPPAGPGFCSCADGVELGRGGPAP